MPRAITHYLFSIDCLNLLDKNTQAIIKDNMDMYLLGSQGPNFFNYYNDLAFLNKKNISLLSPLIHNKKTNDFISNMIMYSSNKNTLKALFNNIDFYNISLSYIYGFLSHYALDKHTHPYIYSLQNSLKNRYKHKSNAALHKSIETHIDSLLLFRFNHLKPYEFNDYLNINLSNDDLFVLCDMYSYLLSRVYNKKVSCEDIKKSYITFIKVEKKINSSPTLFSKVYLNIKDKTSKNGFINNKIYFNFKHCVNDLLNESHNKWVNPFSLKSHNYTFDEIYKYSLDYYLDLSKELDLYLNNKSTMINIISKINNESFLTNQNCDRNFDFKL